MRRHITKRQYLTRKKAEWKLCVLVWIVALSKHITLEEKADIKVQTKITNLMKLITKRQFGTEKKYMTH